MISKTRLLKPQHLSLIHIEGNFQSVLKTELRKEKSHEQTDHKVLRGDNDHGVQADRISR